MDNNNKEGMQGNHDGGRCMMCSMHGGMCGGCGKHHFLRIVLKLIVLALVFWAGVKIGELKGYYEAGYFGSPRMMWGAQNGAYGPGGMMGWYWNGATTTAK